MNSPAVQEPPATDATQRPGSPRLLILLGVLAIMLGALVYDRVYAGPGKDAAKDRIDKTVDAKVNAPVADGADIKDKAKMLTTDKDIREAIGFAPKWTKKEDGYTLQCFHWWGPIPLNRNFLIVRYRGTNPLLYVDYGDGQTPKDGQIKPGNEGPTKAVPGSTDSNPGGEMTAGPGMGPPGGKGKGKGRKKSDDAAAADASSGDSEKKADSDTPTEDKPSADKPSADKPDSDKPKADPEPAAESATKSEPEKKSDE